MSEKPSEYDAIVPIEKMPNCPICGKPITVPATTPEDQLMVFMAHGRAALGHNGCRFEYERGIP